MSFLQRPYKEKLVCLFAILFFASSSNIYASTNDLEVTCRDTTACDQKSTTAPFFEATNLVPGQVITRSMLVSNKRSDGCNLGLKISQPTQQLEPDLTDQLLLTISSQNKVLVTGTLASLVVGNRTRFLDTLNPQTKREYTWQASIAKTASNSYQGASTQFDFDVNFTCDASIQEPTPVPVSSNSDFKSPLLFPNTCTDSAPRFAPHLQLISDSQTTVQLKWSPVAEATSYQVNFGTTDGVLEYSGTNLGLTTEYKVTELDPIKNYFFTIQAINNCAYSPPSNLVTTKRKNALPIPKNKTAASSSPGDEPAVSNQTKVLGSSIKLENSKTPLYSKKRNKMLFLICYYSFIAFLFFLLLFLFRRKRKKQQ